MILFLRPIAFILYVVIKVALVDVPKPRLIR